MANSKNQGVGIIDNDYMAAFDFLVMSWVFQVLEKKGLSVAVIDRLKNLYTDNTSIVVVIVLVVVTIETTAILKTHSV